MKGLKGMQKRFYLFLMLLVGIINASTLDSRRSRGTQKNRVSLDFSSSSLSNVATLNDIVPEAPNSAFLPSEDDIIEYQAVALNDEITYPINDKVSEVIDDDKEEIKPVEISSVDEIKLQPKKTILPKKEDKKQHKKIASLRPDELIKQFNKTKRQLSEIKQKAKPDVSNVVVGEGEEVLVSVSEKTQPKIDTKVIIPTTSVKRPPLPPALNEDDYFPEDSSAKAESPFGVSVANIVPKDVGIERSVKNSVEISKKSRKSKSDISFGEKNNPFVKAFSAIKPENQDNATEVKTSKSSNKKKEKVVSSVSSKNLKQDLYHTYISDNKYLSPVEYYDDDAEFLEEDVENDLEENAQADAEEYAEDADFSKEKNVKDAMAGDVGPINVNTIKTKMQNVKKSSELPSGPLKIGNREVLQMKLDFESGSSAISRESVNIIRSFAQIAKDQPTNSIQIAISENAMKNTKAKKLAARRLAIVSNVLRNEGLSDKQITPVLTNRDIDSFSFRVVNNDSYDKLRVSKGADIFGEEENVKEYDLMRW